VHVSSMVARSLCRIKIFRGLWQNEMLRAQVLAAACAAGVSATFGTPVGGTFKGTCAFFVILVLFKIAYCSFALLFFLLCWYWYDL